MIARVLLSQVPRFESRKYRRFFVFFSSTKTQGGARTLGQVLAIWLFILAAGSLTAGAYVSYAGLSPIGDVMRSMHDDNA
jgi:hypothetical protein